MKQHEAKYFAELLTAVTDEEYVVETLKEGGSNYFVYNVARNGDKHVQPRGKISAKLQNVIRLCKNGLAHL